MAEYQDGQRAVDEETGTPIVFKGGEWVEDASPEVSMTGGGRGRLGWIEDTPELTQRLNTAEPADAFATGILGGGLAGTSVALGAGAGALSGYMGAEEGSGLQETAIGAALGGPAGKLAGMAWDAAAPLARRAADPIAAAAQKATELVSGAAEHVPIVGEAIGRANTGRGAKQLLETARAKAGAALTGAAPQRARSSLLAPDQLAKSLGISEEALTPVQRAMLTYPASAADELGPKLNMALEAERNAVYTGTAGSDVAEAWRGIDSAFSKRIASDAGIPAGQVADPGVISETRRAVGKDIGRVLEENFPDDFVKLSPDYSIARVLNANTDAEVAPALKVLKNYGAVKVGDDGAVDAAEMSLERFSKMKAELQKVSDNTTNVNVRQATDKILQQLDNNAVDGMSGEAREAYSALKYKYKLLSKMQEPGVVSPDGLINPKSFGKQWTRGESKNMRHMNELATLSDTINAVTSKATAGTTGGRSLATDVAPAAGAAVGRLLGL